MNATTHVTHEGPTTAHNVRDRMRYTFKMPHTRAIALIVLEGRKSISGVFYDENFLNGCHINALMDELSHHLIRDSELFDAHTGLLASYKTKSGRGPDKHPRAKRGTYTPKTQQETQKDVLKNVVETSGGSGVSLEAVMAVIEKVGVLQTQVTNAARDAADAFEGAKKLALDLQAGKYAPLRIELKASPDALPTDLGVQHFQFEKLLRMCNARMPDNSRLNIWVHGPAGTGKTTAAKKIADALGLPFWYNGALESKFELMGFVDAMGHYQTTQMRQAWEFGGVYLFDEIDASMPGSLLAFNGALANGIAPFPDGKMIRRHKDCIVIAGANTTGLGGTTEYVGRMKQDAALTNRFSYLDWPIDEQLERAIVNNTKWVEYVQAWRRLIKQRGIKNVMITPRASTYGAALLTQDIAPEDVVQMVIAKEMSPENYAMLKTLVPAYAGQNASL